MATVGNLFVNVRGRTSGLVRDMKKANRSVTKDFYKNEAMARQSVKQAIQQKLAMAGKRPELFEKAKERLAVARQRLAIAQRRPGRLAERRELLGQKARGESMRAALAREAKALIPLVLGVPAAALAFSIRKGVQAFGTASQMAVMGPQGGRFIDAKIGKIMDDMAFAQRADVSEVMARTAELERQNAILWREVGLQFQIVVNQFAEMLGLDISSPGIKGDPNFKPGVLTGMKGGFLNSDASRANALVEADMRRKSGIGTGNIPNYAAGF